MTSCRVCSTEFPPNPMLPLARVCSVKCSSKVGRMDRAAFKAKVKAEKQADKAKRESLKTRSQWMKEVQQEFNAYVRARDVERGCISCGAMTGKMNGGHYRSVGASPELRFNELNCHKQCERCNTYLHGNLIPYRVELIRRIGLTALEALEGPHAPLKLSVADLKALRNEYRAKLKVALALPTIEERVRVAEEAFYG
jgi:hypothetical protein